MKKSLAAASIAVLAAALAGCAPRAPAGAGMTGDAATFATRLGESSGLGGRIVIPLAILEDSRCPNGAQCIHAGTVRLQARIQSCGAARTAIVGLGTPVDIGGAWLHLAAVCPYPDLSRPIAPAEYRLILVISDSAALPPSPIACPPRQKA